MQINTRLLANRVLKKGYVQRKGYVQTNVPKLV